MVETQERTSEESFLHIASAVSIVDLKQPSKKRTTTIVTPTLEMEIDFNGSFLYIFPHGSRSYKTQVAETLRKHQCRDELVEKIIKSVFEPNLQSKPNPVFEDGDYQINVYNQERPTSYST